MSDNLLSSCKRADIRHCGNSCASVFEGNFAKQSVSLCRLGGIDNNHIFNFERFSGKVDRVENALKILRHNAVI